MKTHQRPLEAGALADVVTIERAGLTLSPSGEPAETWVPIGAPRAASIVPLAGKEKSSRTGIVATRGCAVFLRWSEDLANVNPRDRLLIDGLAFDIHEVAEIGRRHWLRLIASRRA